MSGEAVPLSQAQMAAVDDLVDVGKCLYQEQFAEIAYQISPSTGKCVNCGQSVAKHRVRPGTSCFCRDWACAHVGVVGIVLCDDLLAAVDPLVSG